MKIIPKDGKNGPRFDLVIPHNINIMIITFSNKENMLHYFFFQKKDILSKSINHFFPSFSSLFFLCIDFFFIYFYNEYH